MGLRKASRKKSKFRIGISGSSGSGKTMSALKLAYGACGDWDKIAVIDTEGNSSELYAENYEYSIGAFNVLPLTEPFHPDKFVKAIRECEKAGMEWIIVDSASAEWDGPGGCLEIHQSMSGNSFANWSKVGEIHKDFLNAILQSSANIITTTRRKTDYIQTEGSNGKKEVKKVGLKEVQREGFEYELTIAFDVEINHYATASKDRTGLFSGSIPFIIDESVGRKLMEWNESGKAPIDDSPIGEMEIKNLMQIASTHALDSAKLKEFILNKFSLHSSRELNKEQYKEFITHLMEHINDFKGDTNV